MIKAIETQYKGYRFRSRLEARWAVFFDAAEIKWIYEPEGFEFEGNKYLPDFYLPDFGYFEVKGQYLFNEAMMQKFADHIGQPLFIVFEEIPDPNTDKGYVNAFVPKEWIDSDLGFYDGMFWEFNNMFLQCV